MEKENKKGLSCREVVTRHLRIFVSDGTVNERKEIRRSRITNFRDDRPLFYNGKAFTLIELLVVVLIIGILAAVAVPQYQMAVAKTRLATVLPIVDTMSKAQHVYYMANGTCPASVDELDIDFPAGGHASGQWLYYDNGMICGLVGCSAQCEPQNSGKLKSLTIRRYLFPQESLHNKKDFCIATSNPQQGDLAFQKKICRSLGGTAVTDIYFALDF